jgi:hypothetical protein
MPDMTYQSVMNLIFHDLLGIILEIYIDDVVVKSDSMDNHLADLHLALQRMCRYGLKMNPLKYMFGVSAGKFLGFIIHEHGIEIDHMISIKCSRHNVRTTYKGS